MYNAYTIYIIIYFTHCIGMHKNTYIGYHYQIHFTELIATLSTYYSYL